MAKILRTIFILTVFVMVSFAIYLRVRPVEFRQTELNDAYEHLANARLDKLMNIMDIQPGMTVLNIGTGRGLAAYKIAEKLKDTGGKVFATDIKPDLINYVAEEAERRGLDNLYPVLVKKKRVDEFYGKHKYDLILSFHLFLQLYDPVDYFSKMRKYLSKDGHLFIAVNKSFPLFSLADFTDFTGLLGKLSQKSFDSPFYKGLRQSTRELLKEKAIHEPDEPLKESIVADFNGMLLNPNFSIDFLDKEIKGLKFKKKMSFSQDEIYFITWLLLRLKESVYGRKNFTLSFFLKDLDFTNRRLNKYDRVSIKYGLLDKTGQLNKLIIIQKFRPYMYQGKSWESPNPYTSINDKKFTLIKDLMEQAGYQLENKYDFIPFAALLDFKKGIVGIKPKKILNDQEL